MGAVKERSKPRQDKGFTRNKPIPRAEPARIGTDGESLPASLVSIFRAALAQALAGASPRAVACADTLQTFVDSRREWLRAELARGNQRRFQNLKGNRKFLELCELLLCLAEAHIDGKFFLSMGQAATALHISKPDVSAYLWMLRAANIIELVGPNVFRCNEYRFVFDFDGDSALPF